MKYLFIFSFAFPVFGLQIEFIPSNLLTPPNYFEKEIQDKFNAESNLEGKLTISVASVHSLHHNRIDRIWKALLFNLGDWIPVPAMTVGKYTVTHTVVLDGMWQNVSASFHDNVTSEESGWGNGPKEELEKKAFRSALEQFYEKFRTQN